MFYKLYKIRQLMSRYKYYVFVYFKLYKLSVYAFFNTIKIQYILTIYIYIYIHTIKLT